MLVAHVFHAGCVQLIYVTWMRAKGSRVFWPLKEDVLAAPPAFGAVAEFWQLKNKQNVKEYTKDKDPRASRASRAFPRFRLKLVGASVAVVASLSVAESSSMLTPTASSTPAVLALSPPRTFPHSQFARNSV